MLRSDAEKIYTGAIKACLPDNAVRAALSDFEIPAGKLILISVGKAAWRMASSALEVIKSKGGKIDAGAVITKYKHSEGAIPGIEIYEAAHPIPDKNGVVATERVLELTGELSSNDTVLFLVSGGGSALFESPYCSLREMQSLTKKLLGCGADINEINAVRKHISKVKGGRFAEHIYPARIFSVVLSDVLGNRLDSIASGPCTSDCTTVTQVFEILKKYNISVSGNVRAHLRKETPKNVINAEHRIAGSVSELCLAAKNIAEKLGYKAQILTDTESGIARNVGEQIARIATGNCDTDIPLAFIVGGETVVELAGNGVGGRNQEMVLAALPFISGYSNIAFFSVGSDGTDGPTDAAGGYADGESYTKMLTAGIDPAVALKNNDSYNALKSISSLIFTGATGTNVNDISVALISPCSDKPKRESRFANLERMLNEAIKNKNSDC